ncbi:hypothetical protein D3C81_2187750 [compost metagenome]
MVLQTILQQRVEVPEQRGGDLADIAQPTHFVRGHGVVTLVAEHRDHASEVG